jgi:hypothetical protein
MIKGVADGVIIVPPRDFDIPSEWFYKDLVVLNGEIGENTDGMTFVQMFINFRPSIL